MNKMNETLKAVKLALEQIQIAQNGVASRKF